MQLTMKDLDQLGKALSESKTIPAIKQVRDEAEAARRYAKSANLRLELQNRAAEVRLDAERKAGRLLAKMRFRKGGRPGKKNRSHRATGLNNIGITKSQSSRWQQLAAIPQDFYHAYKRQVRDQRKEFTESGLRRAAQQMCSCGRRCSQALRTGSPSDLVCDWHGALRAHDDNNEHAYVVPALLDEMQEHRDLLETILKPLLAAKPVRKQIHDVEWRHVKYLLKQLEACISNCRDESLGLNGH